jgi:KDO2-lipid IV(A) lauroyltransferase
MYPKKRPPRKAKPRWMARAEYGAFVVLAAVLGRLPLSLVYRLTEILVWLFYHLVPRFRNRTRANLEIAFGADRSPPERDDLFEGFLRYHAWFLADLLLAPRLMQDHEYRQRVDVSELDRALRAGGVREDTGALLVGSHQGVPEIGSLAAAAAGWPHTAVVRPLDNPLLWEALLAEREAFDRQHLPKWGALRPAYRIVKNRGIVTLQIDQDAGPNGVFVPYFGTPASTHTGAAMLAALTQAPVYMVFSMRTAPRQFRFKIYCVGPLWSEQSGDRDRDVLNLTARMTAEIERFARRFPEQELWIHRRWKTRPPDRTDAARAEAASAGRSDALVESNR